MQAIKYTLTQQQIIKEREALTAIGHYMLNGFLADGYATPQHERLLQDSMSLLIVDCDKLRGGQQETFDRMPWLARECGRV